MKNKALKLCIIGLISTTVFFSIRQIARATCAFGGFDYETAGYNLFDQALIGKSRLAPFLYEPSRPYFEGLMDSSNAKLLPTNEKEWVVYLGKEPSEAEITRLVSRSKLADLQELKKAVQKQANTLNDSLAKNAGAKYLIRKSDVETCNYLIFAKRCEPHANTGDAGWYSLPVRDTIAMEKLAKEGEAQARSVRNSFIRNRYAFQAARMAHYRGDYTTCLQLCKQYEAAVAADSYISRRFQALEAGAMKHLGQNAEARYRFAMMFDKYYSEDFDFYYRNFAFSTPEVRNTESHYSAAGGLISYSDSLNGYQFCKTAHQKTVLLFLDAYAGVIFEIPAMQNMYALEPQSELLEIMLMRSITEMEKGGFFPKHMYDSGEKTSASASGAEDARLLRAFVLGSLNKGKMNRKYLWEYAAGHLSYMMADYTSAQQYFKLAVADAPSGLSIEKQAKAMGILMEVELTRQQDAGFEARILTNIQWMKANYANDDRLTYLFWRMAQRYETQGDSIRALLCYSQSAKGIDLIARAESHPLAKMIVWMNKTGKSPFEEGLAAGFKYSLGQLYELQGTVFLRQHRLAEALDEFKLAGTANLLPLPADPFEIHFRDCHDCDFAEVQAHPYTKLTFVQRMMELEKLSDASGADQAAAAFDAANGYYNMSYYGNSWMTMAYQRSGYDTADQFFDCSVAQYFYEKARKFSTDPEFQAKCAYMASKCEHNAFYRKTGLSGSADDKGIFRFRSYDKMLKEQYANTNYYNEVIKECSYFSYYVKH